MSLHAAKPEGIRAYAWETGTVGNTGKVVEHWRFGTDGKPLASVLELGDGSTSWSTWKPVLEEDDAELYGCARNRRRRAPDLQTARQQADAVLRKRGVILTEEVNPAGRKRLANERARAEAEQRTAVEIALEEARLPEERELARAALSYLDGRIPPSTVEMLIDTVAGVAARRLAEAELDAQGDPESPTPPDNVRAFRPRTPG